MKRISLVLIIFALLITSEVYAKMPRALIDKNTHQILSWGYTDFEVKNETEVIEDIYLKQGENINNGLRYENGKVIKDPSLAIKVKTEKEKILETLGITEKDIQKIKKLPDAIN
jgi:hypothetical protein